MHGLVQALRTEASGLGLAQRLALASVLAPFGPQSGIPDAAPVVVNVVAVACAVLLVLGFFTRIAALGAGAVLVALIFGGEPAALSLLGLALGLTLSVRGGGAFSVDHLIVRQLETLPLEQEITTDGLVVGRRVGEVGAPSL